MPIYIHGKAGPRDLQRRAREQDTALAALSQAEELLPLCQQLPALPGFYEVLFQLRLGLTCAL